MSGPGFGMDAAEVKRLANDRAESLCEYLFPAGRLDGANFKVGSIEGDKGESLVIGVKGSKVGVFKDFATGEGGNNLVELWRRKRGLEFGAALKEVRDWLGVAPSPLVRRKAVEPRPRTGEPLKRLRYEEVVEDGAVWRWLTEQRKLKPEVIRLYRLGQARFALNKKGPDMINFVIFPFFDGEGNLVRMKYRDIGDKRTTFQKPKLDEAHEYEFGAPKLLFGMQAIPATTGRIGLTEGELDAMSLCQGGALPSVSLPEGAQAVMDGKQSPHDQWLEHDHDWLETFTDIVLALDGDEPGRKAQEQILPRLGYSRCLEVLWPEGVKDANEALMGGEVALDELVMNARDFTPDELKKPGEFAKDIWDEFYPEDSDKPKGDNLPWPLPFQFRPGEFGVWHGYNGHGKTMMMNHCMVDIAKQGKRLCVASLEIPAAKTFRNMVRQCIGKRRPGQEWQLWKVLDWMDEHFIVYDRVGETDSQQLLEAFEYAFRKWGTRHFVLDSLMMLSDVEQDDYVKQVEVCKQFKAFAHEHSVCVHMVCHSKKPSEKRPAEKHAPLKYDISGSSGVPNVADFIIAVWRNIEKEQKLKEASYWRNRGDFEKADKLSSNHEMDCDAKFQCQKQRETGEEPGRFLWFDAESWQFKTKSSESSLIYVDVEEK